MSEDYRIRLAEQLERDGDWSLARVVRCCAEENEACDLCEVLADDDFADPDREASA